MISNHSTKHLNPSPPREPNAPRDGAVRVAHVAQTFQEIVARYRRPLHSQASDERLNHIGQVVLLQVRCDASSVLRALPFHTQHKATEVFRLGSDGDGRGTRGWGLV